MWVSDSKPDLAAYSTTFNDFDRHKFAALPHVPAASPRDQQLPILFFETDEQTLQAAISLSHGIEGRYVHIKFIAAHPLGGSNIDVGTLGLVGLSGRHAASYAPLGPCPDHLSIPSLFCCFMPSFCFRHANHEY